MPKAKQPRERMTPVRSPQKRPPPEGRERPAPADTAPSLDHITPGLRPLAKPIADLAFLVGNLVDHPEDQIEDFKSLLTERGQLEPLFVNLATQPPTVIGGNGRLAAMLALGWTHAAWHGQAYDDATATAISAELNYSGDARVWNKARVDAAVASARANVISGPRLQAMLTRLKAQHGSPEKVDAAPDPGAQLDKAESLLKKWGCKRGDLFVVPSKTVPGKSHRLLCGDSTNAEDVARLMGGERADACLTDPPYNVGKDYGSATDDDKRDGEYLAWCRLWLAEVRRHTDLVVLTPGIVNIPLWIADIEKTHRIIAWVKENQCSRNYIGATSGFNCWEPILVYGQSKKCVARDCFNIPISIQPTAEGHPCPKSVKAWSWLVENFSEEGEVLVDPFLGSGTTLVAGEQLGRLVYGVEISEKYCAVVLERLSGMSLEPRLAETP
jgi:DNA modification methylase